MYNPSKQSLKQVIVRSFSFDAAIEEAQHAINVAHVEGEGIENVIGIMKLMGCFCDFIAMYATLASRDVDCCLIPESPILLEEKGGLFEFIEHPLEGRRCRELWQNMQMMH